ncbi:vWA domain-containing protein [Poritiphilus flavus]|uniref:VWA domain-containing protein n=1 Tax=Poritiphilus flavus TaxID=2697053 RepID=A0A6L9EAG2_9FLAO|nr:VWA domain-containing protein [Poritiphilus flavus]NAS11582.1 VWA domain-containing protein [Poritiphilus flavus]
MPPELHTYQTSLSANIIQFGRFLRSKGYSIGPQEESDALNALGFLSMRKEDLFRQALKTVFSKNFYQFAQFEDLYREFWSELDRAQDSKLKKKQDKKTLQQSSLRKELKFQALKDWLNLNPSEEEQPTASYSDLEVLSRKNFSDLSPDEMELILSALKRIAKRLAHQKSRLRKRTKKSSHLDMKQTVRLNMRTGGEIQRLVFSEKKERKLKLVLLCDVSRSMELYSRFFVHLIYAFQNAYDKIETFVFSTALHQVSEILKNHEFGKAFAMISERVPQWSGGTTIGSCLMDFTTTHAHNLLDKKTIVFILSDGWDTGDHQSMENAMSVIYKKSKKVIWLNPLAGSPNFSPEVLGMKTALPYLDLLAPAHNLKSLKQALYLAQRRRNLTTSPVFSQNFH